MENDSDLVVNTSRLCRVEAAETCGSMNANTTSVQPNANIGQPISYDNQGHPTSAGWVKAVWDQDYELIKAIQPQYYIDVQDCARLHIIGLAHPDLRGERIFAIAGPMNLNDIVKVLRKACPQREWADFPNDEKDLSAFEPMGRIEELLRESFGNGFVGFEMDVLANAAGLIAS
jgi:nucleoside-diphosphate-sugar epimerase